MRSKTSFITLMVSSFILVIAFQNCGSVSENVPGIGKDGRSPEGDGAVNNCMAIAVPYIKIGYLFSGVVPASVEIDVDDEVKYSDCGREAGHGAVIREVGRLEFYLGYETINDIIPNAEIKLYKRNCSSSNRTLIYTSSDQYESYSLCGTNNVRIDVDHMVD